MTGHEKPQPSWGNRKLSKVSDNQPQSNLTVNPENRRNAAACFRNPHKQEDWHADFTGVTVVEGLKDGQRVWVNAYIRTDRKGQKYLTVVLRPQKGGTKQ